MRYEIKQGDCMELIKDNTNVGDVVFDPCAGSGSHLLTAVNLNRRAIGYELNKDYFEIAEKRLKYNETGSQLSLF